MSEKKKIYEFAKEFKRKYPGTVAWRIKKHCKVAEEFIDDDEEVIYAFPAQRGGKQLDIVTTMVLTVTNKRLIMSQKRLLIGSFLKSISKDMFNDITIKKGLFWGKVIIDTIKEVIVVSNISNKALDEIETVVTNNLLGNRGLRKEIGEEDF